MQQMLAAVKGWLRATWSVSVQEDWLGACIDWIRSEEGADLPGARVQELVYEQWLHADLKDTAISGCIPPSVVQERACTLNGKFIVQVDSVLDVSVPAYAQLQTLKGRELDTAEEQDYEKKETKPTRLLLLTLSDGFSVVQGMEHKPVLQLSTQTKPGTKLVLQGAIESRLGVLLLRGEQVSILGGVVEELAERNEQKKVLARILNNEGLATSGDGQVLQPTPHNRDPAVITHTTPAGGQTNMDHDVIEIPDSPVDLNDRRRRSILSPVPSIDLKEFENFEEEDVCLDDNANIEPALVREMEAEQDSDLEWEQDFNESNFEFSRGFGSEATPDQGPSHKDEANTEREQVLSSEPEHEGMHLERDEDIVSMTDSVMRPSSKDTTASSKLLSSNLLTGQSKVHVLPPVAKGLALLTLKDLQLSKMWETHPAVKVKAKFASVVEKLQCDHGLWSITVLIADENGSELKVNLSNKVLETLIGFTAIEFKEDIEPNRSDPSVKARGKKGFQRCQSALAQLHCFMEITRNSSENLPCVERLLDS